MQYMWILVVLLGIFGPSLVAFLIYGIQFSLFMYAFFKFSKMLLNW